MNNLLEEIISLLRETLIDNNAENVRQGYYYCSQEDYNKFMAAIDSMTNVSEAITEFKKNRKKGSLTEPTGRSYMTYTNIHAALGRTINNLKIFGTVDPIADITSLLEVEVSDEEPQDENVLLWIKED